MLCKNAEVVQQDGNEQLTGKMKKYAEEHYKQVDTQGQEFQVLYNHIRGNSPNKDNVGKFLK